MATTLKYRFAVRRRTAAGWTANNEVLLQSEWGHESDTGKLKLGDGMTPWNGLPYLNTDDIPEGVNLYFTKQRVADSLIAGAGVSLTVDGAGNTNISTVSTEARVELADENGNVLIDENGYHLTDNATAAVTPVFDPTNVWSFL